MSEGTDTEGDNPAGTLPADFPEEFRMDEGMVQDWFAIPGDEYLEVNLPRVALDALYTGIERSYFAIIDLVKATLLSDQNEKQALAETATRKVVEGVNSLRQFQTMVMMDVLANRQITRGESDAE